MDGQRFDDLTRNLGRGATRRGLLRGLGGSLLAATAAALGGKDALADHAGNHGGGGNPGGGGRPSSVCCPSGYTAVCPTSGGGHECIDTTSDPNNCGACGVVCLSGQCSDGVCVAETGCPDGTTDCNGECVNLSTDPNNCGGCGVVCQFENATATRSSGTCAIASCLPGYADCDGDPANGCETEGSCV